MCDVPCRAVELGLTFLRGCGRPSAMTADLRAWVESDRTSISKYEISRVCADPDQRRRRHAPVPARGAQAGHRVRGLFEPPHDTRNGAD